MEKGSLIFPENKMIILADVMINWKVVPPPKFKKEYPGKLLRVLKMPPKGQYLGGDYYVGSKIEDKIPDGSVFQIRRRIKDGGHMPVILACSWYCPVCEYSHERIIPEALLEDGSAVFVEANGLKAHSVEDSPLSIYLALPYSHPEAVIRWERFERAAECSRKLMENGYAVMSPIPMGHAILNGAGDTSLKGDFETWRHVCLRMLEASDILCVLTLDGWRDSIGVKAEILHARSLGKPVLFLSYNNGEYFVVPSPEDQIQ